MMNKFKEIELTFLRKMEQAVTKKDKAGIDSWQVALACLREACPELVKPLGGTERRL